MVLDEPAARSMGKRSCYFYCAKPSRRERDAGLEDFPDVNPFARGEGSANFERMGSKSTPRKNDHPTVKPIKLMRYLVRLVTPPGGVVLDPFMGSGTTGCAAGVENRERRARGYSFIGIDEDAGHVAKSLARIRHWAGIAHVEDRTALKRAA